MWINVFCIGVPGGLFLTIVLSHFFGGGGGSFVGRRSIYCKYFLSWFLLMPESWHAVVMMCQLIMEKSNGTKQRRYFCWSFVLFSSICQNGLQFAADIKLPKSRTKQWQCTPNEKKPHWCWRQLEEHARKAFFLVNVSHKVAKDCKQSISYIPIYQDLWHSMTFKFLHSFLWPTMICLVKFANLFRETSLFRNTSLARHGEIRPQETQCHEGFPEGERGKTHAPLGSKRAFLASPWKLNSSPLKIYHPIRKGLSSNHHFAGASC